MFVKCKAGASGVAIGDLIMQSCISAGLEFLKCGKMLEKLMLQLQ